MSESLPMAWDVVKEKLNMIQKKHINKFDNMMDSLDHDFKTIDKKLLPEQPRSSQEVKASLDRLNKFVNLNEGHYFGASVLQMSLYYNVCSFAVWNPDLVAAKMDSSSSNAATKKFIQSKDVVSYLDLPVTDITGVPFKGTAIRPVYSLDSSDDDEQATSSSKRSNPFESDEEELQSSSKAPKLSFVDDSEEEDRSSGKGKKRKKKNKKSKC